MKKVKKERSILNWSERFSSSNKWLSMIIFNKKSQCRTEPQSSFCVCFGGFFCRMQQLHSVGERKWDLIDDNSILKRNDSLAWRLILDPPVQLCQAEHHLPYPKSLCMDSAHHWPFFQATRVNFPPCQWEFDGHLWWLMLLSGQISMTRMWCWWVFLIVSSGFRNFEL